MVESKDVASKREMERLFLDLCFLEVRLEMKEETESFIASVEGRKSKEMQERKGSVKCAINEMGEVGRKERRRRGEIKRWGEWDGGVSFVEASCDENFERECK